MNEAVIVALILFGGTVAGGVIQAWRDRHKGDADLTTAGLNLASQAKTMGEAWDLLYKNSQAEIDEVREIVRRQGETINTLIANMDKVSDENVVLKAENSSLKAQLSAQDIEIKSLRKELELLKGMKP